MGELAHFLPTQTSPFDNGLATIVAAEFSKEAISSSQARKANKSALSFSPL